MCDPLLVEKSSNQTEFKEQLGDYHASSSGINSSIKRKTTGVATDCNDLYCWTRTTIVDKGGSPSIAEASVHCHGRPVE